MSIMSGRDESYVLNLCDLVLNLEAERQKRFDFLRGDLGKYGRRAKLPVDAYYGRLKLVIEYRERQHTEPIDFFNKPQRLTCSGCNREQQRRVYDQRRRDILPQHGIRLIELEYSLFEYNAQKPLRNNPTQYQP